MLGKYFDSASSWFDTIVSALHFKFLIRPVNEPTKKFKLSLKSSLGKNTGIDFVTKAHASSLKSMLMMTLEDEKLVFFQ